MKRLYKKFIVLLLLILIPLTTCRKAQEKSGSADPESPAEPAATSKNLVHKIKSNEEFDRIFKNSGDRLLVIDLYADWCQPCRMLSPILEEIAKEKKKNTDFYKINVDELKQVAAAFRVRNIPYVVFVKNQKVVQALVGLYPKEHYIKIIDQFSG